MVYLGNNELLIISEFAANTSQVGYLIHTSLDKTDKPVFFSKPICYRLTDLCTDSNNNIYGINVLWGGEYKNYIKNCSCKTGIASFDNLQSIDTSLHFAQIIQLVKQNDSTFDWKPVVTIKGSGKNWEGIALIDKHFYVISDANKGMTGERELSFGIIEKSN